MLTPNATYQINGVTVNEKIIPDGTVWKDAGKARGAGFAAGDLYKKQRKLNDTGRATSVTIHNTNDLDGTYDDGEQYTRATYNENMGSSRVHFYVDDVGAWQNLKAGTGMCKNDPEKSAEVSWHAGDGSNSTGGNMTSLSIEVIMDDTAEHDKKAKDNGARVAAWLLWKHGLGIDNLVTHTYWVNKSAGKTFKDVDEQCCNMIYGQKWCPSYIFGSNSTSTALKNWKAFKALVKGYLEDISGVRADDKEEPTSETFEKGELVAIAPSAVYYTGKAMPDFVKNAKWYIKSIKGDRAVIDKDEKGVYSICSPVNTKYLRKVKQPGAVEAGDLVNVAAGANYYNGKPVPSWVTVRRWYVKEIKGDRAVIDKDEKGVYSICSPVNKKYLPKA